MAFTVGSETQLVRLVSERDWERIEARLDALEEQVKQMGLDRAEWLKEDEVANLLGRTNKWLWKQRVAGKLSYSKVGRATFYLRSEVMALLDRGQIKRRNSS